MKTLFKTTLILLFPICLLGCWYFNTSPVDGVFTKNVTEKPADSTLIGSWEIDKFSYDLIEERGYEMDEKVELILHENHHFDYLNFPECNDVFIDSGAKKYSNLSGKWEIQKDLNDKYWVLNLVFDPNEYYENGLTTNYSLYHENEELIIWEFIGDPDTGERFLFKKEVS